MKIHYRDDKKERFQSVEAKTHISKCFRDEIGMWDVDISIELIACGEDQKEAKRNFILPALKTIEFLNQQIKELREVL